MWRVAATIEEAFPLDSDQLPALGDVIALAVGRLERELVGEAAAEVAGPQEDETREDASSASPGEDAALRSSVARGTSNRSTGKSSAKSDAGATPGGIDEIARLICWSKQERSDNLFFAE